MAAEYAAARDPGNASDHLKRQIEALPDRQRKRLIHPLLVTRRWRASLDHDNGKCPTDLRRDAKAAWRRFRACLEALPAEQAGPLWQMGLLESRTLGGCPFEESDYQQ